MLPYDLTRGAELRPLGAQNAAELFEFVQANRAHLGEWLRWTTVVHSEADARRFLNECDQEYVRTGMPTFGIWQNDRLAGGIVTFALPEANEAELAYWLGQAYERQGLMTRALRAVIHLLFQENAVKQVQIRAELDNTRSRAVAERVGFTYRETEAGGWTHGDHLVDLAVYTLTAVDWKILQGIEESND